MSDNLTFNFSEFTTFLLLYAANADLEFTEDERKMIMSRVSKDTFEKVNRVFEEQSDYARLQTIMDYKGLHYPTVARRDELFDMMRKLFEADGEYSTLEKNLMMFLDKLM